MAFTFYPWIITTKSEKAQPSLMNHESIHLEQQKELWVVPFYFLYYLSSILLFLRYFTVKKAYLANIFEAEAYVYQDDFTYLTKRKKLHWWSNDEALARYKNSILSAPSTIHDYLSGILLFIVCAAFLTALITVIFQL